MGILFGVAVESLLLVILLLIILRYYIHRKWQYFTKYGIPHDPPSILNLGHARKNMSNEAFSIDVASKLKHGPVWGFYIGVSPRIVIHDVSILQQIFIKEFSTFPNRQTFLLQINGKEMANDLLHILGKQWKRVRSTMTPTFSAAKLRQMAGIVDWCTNNTLELFRKRSVESDGRFTATRVFPCLSMDVICSAAFSTRVNSQDDTKEEPEIAAQAKKLFSFGFFNPFFILCIIFPFLEPLMGEYVSRKSFIVYFRKLTNHLIERRKKEMDKQDRVDLMQLMLEAEVPDDKIHDGLNKGMTRIEIMGNSMLMILAGYETTASAMTFLAYNLAFHPKIQADLQKEVDDLYETKEKVDYDTVNNLKLLDMCLSESLRLYNPVARTIRRAEREITLNGLTIPAGALVIIPIYALGHDPEYWDSPMEFRPERMRDRDMSQIDPMMFNPFGAGPRNCIGQRFAIMEIKMAFCKFLRHYTFKPAENTPRPPLKMRYDMTIRPLETFDLLAVKRE